MIRSMEHIVDEYLLEVSSTPNNPVLVKLMLDKISNDLIPIKLNLNKYKSNKLYDTINDKLIELIHNLDTLKHKNTKKLAQMKRQSIAATHPSQVVIDDHSDPRSNLSPSTYSTGVRNNDVNELRKRLLENNRSSLTNDYHETLQQDLIHDLSDMVSDMKDGAIRLSKKIMDDNVLLSRTQDNMMKNDSLMNTVGSNLTSYVLNKSGGKISFWFLIKTMAAVVVLFLIMSIIINILPKM
ncbi:hypothetical protein PSN45_000700 [Yamadazyma tenuis]|uniref:Uncharacterized protein n=1 Tax=Candida tenuis (strain ATCC 10573 / BCRC 21748 / CBS 615 / JCM 9827 / NBRC 10315 / NRRL Y-1498 / VKM Y-70) TaxID=590646 RepID=G3BA16_CANTC|nr:uncharacterized protein CANTEDRAFT_99092 [Yamadazyma tenuis ATCC 10573]EGV61988.1 hypothetical protein CANTEDRAFT_99092 [Yamadazyma tenuis ATCC 10573]WEJ93239.1 hypothetical protein PSN45_000700 [Yamadazyma tenuis]